MDPSRPAHPAKHLLPIFSPMWAIFKQLDAFRQWQGKLLDLHGGHPHETPYRTVLREAGMTLRAYEALAKDGPVVVIIPAPIKKPTIWDIAPSASVIRQCMRGGVRTFLIEWTEPRGKVQQAGLAEYADRFILQCLNAIEEETGEHQVFFVSHSLGGALGAIFASLYPERLRGLVLLGSPINLGKDAGDLAPMVLSSLPAQLLAAGWSDIPGSFLSIVSSLASPKTFLWDRWMDWTASLADARTRKMHLRANRWMLDEMPMPKRLFQETIELLYRENRFMAGALRIRGRNARPCRIEAPVLSIVDPQCRIAPLQSVLPFHEVIGSTEKRVLFYGGDTGVAVQHLGMLVGESAHRSLWPEILKWIHTCQ